MHIKLMVVAKTNADWLQKGEAEYLKRLQHYCKFEYKVLPPVKNAGKLPIDQLKKKEGDLILAQVRNQDCVVLLDERGKEFTSPGLARFVEGRLNQGNDLIFLIGGAYGFSSDVQQRANFKVALSQQTFSHQMVRVFFLEQLYRAFTIIRGEKYHH